MQATTIAGDGRWRLRRRMTGPPVHWERAPGSVPGVPAITWSPAYDRRGQRPFTEPGRERGTVSSAGDSAPFVPLGPLPT